MDWVLALPGLPARPAVADLGCGTGISARLFAARGCAVVGVDPSEEMLAFARAAGGATYRRGEAALTGLPAASVDLVTAGQSFHWFELPSVMPEVGRILRPGGWCAAFWNVRDSGPFMDEYERLLTAQSSEYRLVPRPEASLAAIKGWPTAVNRRETAFPNAQSLDRQGLRGRAHSSSFVVHGLSDLAGFDRRLDALFDLHQRDGTVEMTYRTVALAWQLDVTASPSSCK